MVICDCDEGYETEFCNATVVILPPIAGAGMGTGAIVGISLLLLLLLCKDFISKLIQILNPSMVDSIT